jgi:phosphoribosylanthranilate isomerase
MMVDYLCFELNEQHSDYIPLEKILEIKGWVNGPRIGGRLESWPPDYDFERMAPDFLVLAGPDLLGKASEYVSEVFIESPEDLEPPTDNLVIHQICDHTSFRGITHRSIFVDAFSSRNSTFNIDEVIENKEIIGISIRGSKENRPGFKEYGDLMEILEALEEE